MRRRTILSGLLALFFAYMPLCVAAEVTLQVGITGDNKLQGLEDPVTVARLPEVTGLLQRLADQPRDSGYIEQALQGSEVSLERLLGLSLIKQHGEAYAIGFNYVTLEDHDTLIKVLEPYAEDLAQRYRDAWHEFEAIFAAYEVPGVPVGETAYAVLGAMSLDWDGLDLTAEKGMRITAKNLPAGRDFVLWAKEQSAESHVKGLYWGSHNTESNGVRFTSFGDHYSLPRMALPDLLWIAGNRVAAIEGAGKSLRMSLHSALAPYYQDDFLADVARIMRLLRTAAQSPASVSRQTPLAPERASAILELLRELQYLSEEEGLYALATPFFSMADQPMTDAARALSWQLMDDWLDRNGAAVEDSLGELTAIRYGVPYKQLFTQIWHYLFGLANKALVESGHFADPYAEERLAKAIVPFAFDQELLDLQTEARSRH
jgi:hypothetical protein